MGKILAIFPKVSLKVRGHTILLVGLTARTKISGTLYTFIGRYWGLQNFLTPCKNRSSDSPQILSVGTSRSRWAIQMV